MYNSQSVILNGETIRNSKVASVSQYTSDRVLAKASSGSVKQKSLNEDYSDDEIYSEDAKSSVQRPSVQVDKMESVGNDSDVELDSVKGS